MSIEKVKAFLEARGLAGRVLELEASSATVSLAAQALGCEPCRIAKTLSFLTGAGPILVVAAGDARTDNARFKAQFGVKARMIPPEQAEELVGHAVGGVCPFAVNSGVKIFLDRSLRRFSTVFPACGTGNSAIEMTCEELEAVTGGLWVDVCRDWA